MCRTPIRYGHRFSVRRRDQMTVMQAEAAMLAPGDKADLSGTAAAIAAFMRRASIEATRPNADDVRALGLAAAPGTQIYLSAVLTRPQEDVIAQAVAVRAQLELALDALVDAHLALDVHDELQRRAHERAKNT